MKYDREDYKSLHGEPRIGRQSDCHGRPSLNLCFIQTKLCEDIFQSSISWIEINLLFFCK